MSRFWEEIAEQPAVASRLLRAAWAPVREAAAEITAAGVVGIVIAARGTSDHAAVYGKFLLEVRNRRVVALASPSEVTRYGSAPDLARFAVIGISQSGASPDVVAVMTEAGRQGALTLAITNQEDSELGRAAHRVLELGAGPELSVPASKTYTASLLLLAMLSAALDPDPDFEAALNRVPEAIQAALQSRAAAARAVPILAGNRMVVLGRGYHLATALEVGLKLTETCYILTRAGSVADFMHGPVSVAEPGLPVLLVTSAGPLSPELRELARTLSERGARVVRLGDDAGDWEGLEAEIVLETRLPEALSPIPLAVAGQILALGVAGARGLDPDHPRLLSKVTRTW